jgi:hypothetical protein
MIQHEINSRTTVVSGEVKQKDREKDSLSFLILAMARKDKEMSGRKFTGHSTSFVSRIFLGSYRGKERERIDQVDGRELRRQRGNRRERRIGPFKERISRVRK